MTMPAFIRSSTVAATLQSNGVLRPCVQSDASINVTYNYGRYYYETAKGDKRFSYLSSEGNTEYGIRGLYGKTASESISMLADMCNRIKSRYTDDTGKWIITKRKARRYFDENGDEIKDIITASLQGKSYTSEEYEYEVSEGDTSNYWEATAANAIEPLLNMILFATDSLANPNSDAVWDGD
jgi:hypothetical protein